MAHWFRQARRIDSLAIPKHGKSSPDLEKFTAAPEASSLSHHSVECSANSSWSVSNWGQSSRAFV